MCSKIIQQTCQYENDEKIQSIKLEIRSARLKRNNEKQNIRSQMIDKQIRLNDLNQETGASTWLTTLPLKEEGYTLTKNCSGTSSEYVMDGSCLESLKHVTVVLSLICNMHYLARQADLFQSGINNIRNVTATLLKEVCKDVRIEPSLQPLTGPGIQ